MNPLELFKQLVRYFDSSPEWSFAKNTVKRVFVFTLIALSAVGLNSIVESLKAGGAPTWLTFALSAAEFVLVVADVLWFVKPLLLEISETLRSIFRGAAPVFISFLLVAILFWAASTPAALAYFKVVTASLVESTKAASGAR